MTGGFDLAVDLSAVIASMKSLISPVVNISVDARHAWVANIRLDTSEQIVSLTQHWSGRSRSSGSYQFVR